MDDKKTTQQPISEETHHHPGENLEIHWSVKHEERLIERDSRGDSIPGQCKGTHCETAFEKL